MSHSSNATSGCAHASADGLFFYVQGRLDGSALDELESHIAECEQCQVRHETLGWIHAQVVEWGKALFRGHVPSQELVRYAESAPGLDAARCFDIEEHLALCDACHADLAMLQDVSTALEESSAPAPESFLDRLRQFLRPSPVPALAYALVLLLAVPAIFGLRGWMATEDGGPPVTTLPAPQLLSPLAEREAAVPSVVYFSVTEPLVIEFNVPILDDSSVRYDARRIAPTTAVVWRATDLKSNDDFGTFLLVLDPEQLIDGDYRLVVEEIEAATNSSLDRFEFPFELRLR
jgi:anti-sigma factor RsiW